MRRHAFHAITLLALLSSGAASAVNLDLSGYSENFDSMGAAGTAPPVGWTVYTGPTGSANSTWTSSIPGAGVAAMVLAPTPLTATAAPGGNNNNGFNAAALTGPASDRVLATAPTTVSGAALQLALTNNTGAALGGIGLSFDTVRYTTTSSANELPGYWLFYSLDGSSWTNVASLSPTLATVPNSTGVTPAATMFSFATAVAQGGTFYLRWVDDNAQQTSPDQIIGLNNVQVSAVPLPATLPLLLGAMGGLGTLLRRRRNIAG
jgi:hypothetical protein